MQRKSLVFVAVVALFIQTLFGSLPAMAMENLSPLRITMTTNGQAYNEGDTATNPVEVTVTTTSGDSAGIEISQDARTTWQPFDHTQPLVMTEDGEHELWFRLADVEERRIIKIDSQPLSMMQAMTVNNAIIYVTENGSGNKDGTSWANAFAGLQAALDEATNRAKPVQIWIAAGTYKPTKQIDSSDPRTATFQMQNNVAIYGGFNGTETDLTARDWKTKQTILSGDIGTEDDKTDNVYHVFYHPAGLHLNQTAILDGVTITRGNANSDYPHNSGGGMFNSSYNSPALTNVTFSSNTATNGGGICNIGYSSLTLMNVMFQSNEAIDGGGMLNNSNSPTLTNVTFSSNTATNGGGGMANSFSTPKLTNVMFSSNEATNIGGGMYNMVEDAPTLINVTMSDNETKSENKGAIYGGSLQIRNSIIVGNKGEPALNNVGATIENSLLDVEVNGGVLAKFHQSNTLIEDNTYAPEAIFMDPAQQNYQLRAKSPAIDRGENSWNETSTDLAGNLRIQGSAIDLGAYEAFPYYDVTYNANGATTGDVPLDTLTYRPGDKVTVQANSGNLARTGYTFAGWSTHADGGGTSYNADDTFQITANIKLYAKWIPNLYKVIFESNGGSAIAEQQVPYNEKAIAPPVPSKQGHTFAGWYTDENEKWDFAVDVVTKDITLYAQWTANPTYTVTYDANGATDGIVPHDNQVYEEKAQVTVQGNSGNLTRIGYTFAGWNTQADGQGDSYAENNTFTMGTSNQILYAKWIPNTYTVIFESNGGSDVAEQQVLYNEKVIEPPVPSRQGHTFAGWYTDENEKWDFAVDVVTKDITLYAQWTANPTYTVTYDANGATDGIVPHDNQVYEEKAQVTVQGNSGNLARTGYTFAGWNTQVDGQGDSYTENDTFTMGTSNQILYAKWIPNTYTVIFESNGGSDVAEQQVPYNEKAIEPPMPSKRGYTFAGWYTDENEKWDFAVDVVKKDITLYAQWQVISNPPPTDGGSNPPPISNNNDAPPAKVTITLHTNGGTAIAPIDIAYNTKISDLPIPTREGYRFDGWYQDEVLTKPWAADTVLRENISLYAKWTALPVEEPQPQPEPEAPSPTVTFSDIKRHWAQEMIEELAAQGIIQGYEDGTFRPNESISRMHVAALLTRAFSFEQVRAGDDFKDVSPTHPYYEAIMTLQQAGIVDGTNGAFLPNEKMTRAQLAKVLVGLMGRTPDGTSTFTDVASTHWSAGYIAVLEQEGIALGDNGKFNPNAPVTRAQFVTFLYRILQNQ